MPDLMLPFRDAKRCWCSTFSMVKGTQRSRSVLHTFCRKVDSIRGKKISEEDWERTTFICTFLETAETVTTEQSSSNYFTLSMSRMPYHLLVNIFSKDINDAYVIISP